MGCNLPQVGLRWKKYSIKNTIKTSEAIYNGLLFLCCRIMLSVKTFNISDTVLYKDALEIRKTVFIKGQNVDPALEIENEDQCTHYLLLLDEKPIGTARWRETEKGIKLERFAILDDFRNKGYGTVILEKVLEDILPMGQKIYLHSQLKAVNYYQRQGFMKTGKIFKEAGIDHYLMVREPGEV